MASPPRGQYYDVAGYSNSNIFTLVTTTRVTVYVAQPYAASPLTTLASIYSAETGAGTPGNPFNATTGEISFWAAPGSYDLKIEDTGSPAKFATKFLRWDVLPADEGVAASTMLTDLSIDVTKYQDRSVTAAKIEAQQAWQTLTGGVNGMSDLHYFKDSLGMVRVRPEGIATPNSVNGSTIPTFNMGWVFPAGYRPGTPVFCLLVGRGQSGTGDNPYPITIGTDGSVSLVGSNSIGGFSQTYANVGWEWRAEN